jgi:hypothetical protein
MRRKCYVHKFIVDAQNVGTCSLCGEVRQYPTEKGGEIVVLKKGNPRCKRESRHAVKAPTGGPGESKDSRLPRFPEFSEDWPQVVKVKWLEVYQRMSEIAHKEG